ncbi:hypothetical protein AAFF_G00370850 [Aldrovandia affinis]|uniref:Uncharacterized protein n=1 Tax=Aldrovandia affinis TaxID=143900 RepID=A0AAD7SGU6_9TELE|nr:hypothetical protein AAFF_G00370850 [Aldrovandia affinis]
MGARCRCRLAPLCREQSQRRPVYKMGWLGEALLGLWVHAPPRGSRGEGKVRTAAKAGPVCTHKQLAPQSPHYCPAPPPASPTYVCTGEPRSLLPRANWALRVRLHPAAEEKKTQKPLKGTDARPSDWLTLR